MKNLFLLLILSTLLISCVPNTKQFQNVETGEVYSLIDQYDLAMFDTLVISKRVHSHLPTKVKIWGIYNNYIPDPVYTNYYSIDKYTGDSIEYTSITTYQLVTEVK